MNQLTLSPVQSLRYVSGKVNSSLNDERMHRRQMPNSPLFCAWTCQCVILSFLLLSGLSYLLSPDTSFFSFSFHQHIIPRKENLFCHIRHDSTGSCKLLEHKGIWKTESFFNIVQICPKSNIYLCIKTQCNRCRGKHSKFEIVGTVCLVLTLILYNDTTSKMTNQKGL